MEKDEYIVQSWGIHKQLIIVSLPAYLGILGGKWDYQEINFKMRCGQYKPHL